MGNRPVDLDNISHATLGTPFPESFKQVNEGGWYNTAPNVWYNGIVIIQDNKFIYYPLPTVEIFEPEIVDYVIHDGVGMGATVGLVVLGFRVFDFKYQIKLGWRDKADYMEWKLEI